MAKGISIHIGVPKVNEKEKGEFGTLQGCDNDATEMAKLAKTRGFRGLMPDGSDADEPQVLVDEDAKKPTILKLIQTAAIRLEAGDFFLMTYSGHGGQAKNQNPADEKDDGEDEFLHPFDE